MLAGAALLCTVGIFYAISSARLSVSLNKGKQRLRAYLCIGAAICISAVAAILYQARLPIYEASGTIEAAQVHSEGKGHRTNLRVRVGSGAELVLNADGISPYFRSGQQAHVRYHGYSGSILKARFISSTGSEEGVFNGTDAWPPYWWLLGGLLVLAAGFRKNGRDPEGSERA
jgi:hypothetical protein